MKPTRRQVFRTLAGASASLGIATSESCARYSLSDFFVICHGMMAFGLQPPNRSANDPGSLILHLPNVPKMADASGHVTDPGHIYLAAGHHDVSDYVTLATALPAAPSSPALFFLEGLDADVGISSVAAMDHSRNVILDQDSAVTLQGNGASKPLVQVLMPLPQHYKGWRTVYCQDNSSVVYSSQSPPPLNYFPAQGMTMFMVHIFIYSSSQQPILRSAADGKHVWPNANTSQSQLRTLHIFAQPPSPHIGDADHSQHLHDLFSPCPNIQVKQSYCIREEDPARTVSPIFTRDDLLDWNDGTRGESELLEHCYTGKEDPLAERLLTLQPTNCRSYGGGGSGG